MITRCCVGLQLMMPRTLLSVMALSMSRALASGFVILLSDSFRAKVLVPMAVVPL